MYVAVFFTITDRASIIPSNILAMVASPVVRGLLDRERSEGHLQSSNESIKTEKEKKKKKEKNRIKNKQTQSNARKYSINSIGRIQRRAGKTNP